MLRFFSALLVLGLHLGIYVSMKPDSEPLIWPLLGVVSYPELHPYFWFGWIGVQIFFVISGFVIGLTANGSTPFAFLRSRILRLVPTVFICATITASVIYFESLTSLSHLARIYFGSIFFVPVSPWVDAAYWTLGVEVCFYALVFLLLCLSKFNKIPFIFGVISSISSLVWIGIILVYIIDPAQSEALSDTIHKRPFHLLMITFGCNFGVGLFLWLYLLNKATKLRLAILTLSILGSMCEILTRTLYSENPQQNVLLPMLIWIISITFMIITIMYNHQLQHIFPRFIRKIGLITFPLYLVHGIVGFWIIYHLTKMGISRVESLLLTVSIIILISWIIVDLIEPKMSIVFKKAFGSLQTKAMPIQRLNFLFKKNHLHD